MSTRAGLAAATALAAVLGGCVSAPGPASGPRPRMVSRPVVQSTDYVVQSGDTLSGVAQKLGVDMVALGRANDIPPPYVIRIGQRLRMPPRGTAYRAPAAPRPAPTLTSPAPALRPGPAPAPSYIPPQPSASVAQPRTRIAGAPPLTWPTDGALSARFGESVNGLPANGIDLAAYSGMAVRSAAAGTVIFAGREPERFGYTVIIDHGGGWMTVYGYLGRLTVTVGEVVKQRTRIAFVGKSGEAQHPTVHFEVRRDNVPLDPQVYLPPRL